MKKHNRPWVQPAFHTALAALWITGMSAAALAQEDNTAPHSAVVPNPMGIHTWFIILAVGAFLAWSISYSLQLQKEALRRRASREGLMLRKNQYINQLAALETKKSEGAVSESLYKREFNNTRLRLANVLKEIEQSREGL